MAKRPATPQRHSANLSLDEIDRAVPRLRKRIADLEAFDPSKLQQRNDPQIAALQASIEETLIEVFGHDSFEYQRYGRAAHLDSGPVSLGTAFGRGGVPDLSFRSYIEEGKQRSIALLNQAIAGLNERAESLKLRGGEKELIDEPLPPAELPRKVFIVHGHDEAARETVARFLEKIGFEVVILHEQANKGRALITKFNEEAAGIGFAVVLMTPDDMGGAKGREAKPRARQNVIFELGFFIGKLGPGRVAAIIAGDVELPSDYEGVVYIRLDTDWRTQLARELQAASYEIDWNKIMR
jgi:Predicted nucleotide-binding protein containing TIR-like domain